MRPSPIRTARWIAAGLAGLVLLNSGGPASWAQGFEPAGGALIHTPVGMDQFSFLADAPAASGGISGDAWGLMESNYTLNDIDPMTGNILPNEVNGALGAQASIQADMLAAEQLAFNAAQAAAKARAEAEERKRKALAEAKSEKARVALQGRRGDGTPQPWQMKNFSSCGSASNTRWQARIELVNAFEEMCQAARADGVNLVLNSAFRDPKRQKVLFDQAVAKYGSSAAARKWVAPSDGESCNSRHCAGIAIDVSQQGAAGGWLHTRVGCARGTEKARIDGGACGAGETPIQRIQLYGMIQPMSYEPWHYELGIPLADEDVAGANKASGASCNPSRSLTVPQMVGAIFRCKLEAAGIKGDEQRQIGADALVMSKCESGWNAEVVIAGGRYVNTPNPRTGNLMTAAGVFQFLRPSANQWVDGGYANVKDPIANINGAADYFIVGYKKGGRKQGWQPWACASLADHAMSRSILPGFPGGPASLPAWAYQY